MFFLSAKHFYVSEFPRAARTYLLASTLLQIFKDFTLINDWGFRTQRTHDVSVYTNFQECTADFIQLM